MSHIVPCTSKDMCWLYSILSSRLNINQTTGKNICAFIREFHRIGSVNWKRTKKTTGSDAYSESVLKLLLLTCSIGRCTNRSEQLSYWLRATARGGGGGLMFASWRTYPDLSLVAPQNIKILGRKAACFLYRKVTSVTWTAGIIFLVRVTLLRTGFGNLYKTTTSRFFLPRLSEYMYFGLHKHVSRFVDKYMPGMSWLLW
jgi:hypothetical protein